MSVPGSDEMVAPLEAVRRHSDTGRVLLTMTAYSMVGNSVLAAQPMVVGGLVDILGFSERQAGIVASTELLGFALSGLVLLTFVHRVSRRVLALCGVVLLVCADIASCFVTSFVPMLLLRFVAGMGAMAGYSVFPLLAAASAHPERVIGIVNAVSIAYAGVLVWIAPRLLQMWHLVGVFLTMGLLSLAVSPTIMWAPARGATHPASRSGGAPVRGGLNYNILMMLLVLFILYVGHGGIWAYQERIGIAAGLTKHAVGLLLGSSMLIWGVLGSLLASWLGLALGRVWPQITSLGASIVAAAFLVFGTSTLAYGTACGLIAFSWFYGLPYQTGLLALFDPRGRANIAGSLAGTGGSAVGPAFAAGLLGYGGHFAVGLMASACYVVCLTLVLLSLKNLVRAHPEVLHQRNR